MSQCWKLDFFSNISKRLEQYYWEQLFNRQKKLSFDKKNRIKFSYDQTILDVALIQKNYGKKNSPYRTHAAVDLVGGEPRVLANRQLQVERRQAGNEDIVWQSSSLLGKLELMLTYVYVCLWKLCLTATKPKWCLLSTNKLMNMWHFLHGQYMKNIK